MSGHVFHPGHEELHGVTVVVEGPTGMTWVGRYHERTDRGVMMHDVAIHDPQTAEGAREAWIERLIKYGVRIDARHLVVPADQATRITRLLEWTPTGG
ncbi:MAG TPA: hypothetical protein VFU03_07505 [Gemmatimonadales bacterium]|nr:hypothetical protein [Gemmatimonadales bacterium]